MHRTCGLTTATRTDPDASRLPTRHTQQADHGRCRDRARRRRADADTTCHGHQARLACAAACGSTHRSPSELTHNSRSLWIIAVDHLRRVHRAGPQTQVVILDTTATASVAVETQPAQHPHQSSHRSHWNDVHRQPAAGYALSQPAADGVDSSGPLRNLDARRLASSAASPMYLRQSRAPACKEPRPDQLDHLERPFLSSASHGRVRNLTADGSSGFRSTNLECHRSRRSRPTTADRTS